MRHKVSFSSIIHFCLVHKYKILFAILLITFIFFRFYQLFERANLTWDQVDSAWAAKSILLDKHFIINGPVAKGNSGIYMGPLYFYTISIFYFFTNMDPIASPIFPGVMSIINLLVLFFVTKKIFGIQTAFVAGFINTFSIYALHMDRVQSGYYLIVLISYLIFYALYEIMSGKITYIPLLGLFTGLAFHIDFTSVFYPLLILLCVPFFPRRKEIFKYIFIAIPIFLVFLIPIILVDISTKHSTVNSLKYLFDNYYHGFHFIRVFQITHFGVVSFQEVLQFGFLKNVAFLILPIFFVVYYIKNGKKKSFPLFYLMILWVVVPWLVLSAYSGELTEYYFSLPIDFIIAILAYFTVLLFVNKSILIKLIPVIFWGIYITNSLQIFFSATFGNLLPSESAVRQAIKEKKVIKAEFHDPRSYLYYIYTNNKKG